MFLFNTSSFPFVVDVKIKALDKELLVFKEQLKKAKGPTADHIKKRALDTLKRKKLYEGQRDMLAGQAFNVEQTSFAIESVKDTQTTVQMFFFVIFLIPSPTVVVCLRQVAAMKLASKTLKVEQKKINLSDIEDMQDDLTGSLVTFFPFLIFIL